MFSRLKEWLKTTTVRVKRYILTVKVDVYPHSPFYPPRAVVTIIMFKRLLVPVEEFKTKFTRNYDVDIDHIFHTVPVRVHRIHMHYPEDWFDKLDYARATDDHYYREDKDGKPIQ